jgi:putative endonuclease
MAKKLPQREAWTVYILECKDTTLYVGSTNDVEKRLREHNHRKSGARYTKTRRPVVLRYTERFPTMGEARKREAALKRLTRRAKLELIAAA